MFTQSELLSKINHALEALTFNGEPKGMYDPIRYVLSMGGKRIRPILMLLTYNLYKDDVDSIMSNALALETYHNFTLLHDDVMDNADLRRGNPTVHKKWNENTAILSGDAMLILSYRLMTEYRASDSESTPLGSSAMNQNVARALKTFTEATLGVCEGQQFDMDFETRNNVKEEEYLEMIRLKTSLLLASAAKIGAELAGASEEDAQNLYEYGEKMGLAFQLQDDLLDVYGDPAVFGKKIGGDILCNKKTFMLIHAKSISNAEQESELNFWISEKDFVPEEKINAVRSIYDALDMQTICRKKIEELFALSLDALDKVNVSTEKKECLREYAHQLMGRNY
jgi:geranylgeranyl diphosphate synthase type II